MIWDRNWVRFGPLFLRSSNVNIIQAPVSVSTRIISLGATPFSFFFELSPYFVTVSIMCPTPLTFQGSEKVSFIRYQDNRLTRISSMSSFLMKNFIAVTLTSFRNKCVEIETSRDFGPGKNSLNCSMDFRVWLERPDST